MRRRRFTERIVCMGALITCLAAIVGCGGGGSSSSGSTSGSTSEGSTTQNASTDGESSEPIVIGAAIAKTGTFEPFDVPTLEAFKMKVEKINAAGGIDGRQIKIVEADTKSDPAQGRRAAEQVIGEGAEIMLVTCDFDFGSPAAGIAEAEGMVSFSLCAQSPKFGVDGIGPLAYTAATADFSEGAILAAFAQKRGWDKSAFLLNDETISYDSEVCNGFEQVIGNGVIGSASFKNEDTSIASQITKIQNANPEVIVLCSYPPGGASAIRQIRAAGIDTPILAPNAMDGTYWIESVPNLSEFFVSSIISVFGDDPNPAVNKFVAEYAKRTGAPPPTGFVATGYAIAEALEIAIKKAGTTEGEALAEVLNTFDEVPLLIGPTTWTPELHIETNRPMAILQYTDGKPKYLESVSPAGEVELSMAG